MTLAKSSLEIAREYLELVPAELEPERFFARSLPSTSERVGAVLAILGQDRLLERSPCCDARSGSATPMSTR